MSSEKLASHIAATMFEKDTFAQWLGVEFLEIKPGKAVLQMKVRKDMLNGNQVGHGGITFSLADTAMGFAANSRGQMSVALEANISFPAKVLENEILIATAEELTRTRKTAVFGVMVCKEDGTKVGVFRGTSYGMERSWFIDD